MDKISTAPIEMGDRVWIESLQKEGLIVGWSVEYKNSAITYDVRYKTADQLYNIADPYFSFAEYLGPKYSYISCTEQDIEILIDDITLRTCQNILDRLNRDLGAGNNSIGSASVSAPEDPNDWVFNNPISGDIEKDRDDSIKSMAKKCSHEWKNYNGFTSSYDYCIKCDLKK